MLHADIGGHEQMVKEGKEAKGAKPKPIALTPASISSTAKDYTHPQEVPFCNNVGVWFDWNFQSQ
jgi:hypothetical protein